MRVRVKICGITNIEDALAANEAGADALGFIFHRASPRFIEPDAARSIIAQLPPFVSRVGVFVDETVENVSAISRLAGLSAVQLHGTESPDMCRALPSPVIKAFRVQDQNSLSGFEKYHVSAFLLDSYVPDQPGGTGSKFNWDLAVKAKSFGRPIILAGGLTPENITDAITKTTPYAVDVSSGVESSPGRKDHKKLREFISRANSCNLRA